MAGTIGSSFRTYYDYPHNPPRPLITAPTGVTLTFEDVGYPRELADRSYTDIQHWRDPTVGGHFLPLEEPELLAARFAPSSDPSATANRATVTTRLKSKPPRERVTEHDGGSEGTARRRLAARQERARVASRLTAVGPGRRPESSWPPSQTTSTTSA